MFDKLKFLWQGLPKWWIFLIILFVLIGIIFSFKISFFIIIVLFLCFVAFLWLRELYWWICGVKLPFENVKKYTIKKGKHYPSVPWFSPILIKDNKDFFITRDFMFSESCFYTLKNKEDQNDVNKLFGFSIGKHHNWSYRFGWRPNKDNTKIEIIKYEYLNSKRLPSEIIGEVEIDKWYEFEISYFFENNKILYGVLDLSNLNDVGDSLTDVDLKKHMNWGYTLGLYFGGNQPAPHDIVIYGR